MAGTATSVLSLGASVVVTNPTTSQQQLAAAGEIQNCAPQLLASVNRYIRAIQSNPYQLSMAQMVPGHKAMMNALYQSCVAVANLVGDQVYNPTGGATVQQQFDAWGNGAVDLCKLSDAICALRQAYEGVNVSVVPAGTALTRNSDGTVTVGQAAQ